MKKQLLLTLTGLAFLSLPLAPAFAADKAVADATPAAKTEAAASTKKVSEPTAVIKTSMGSFTVKLYKDKAPLAVNNFIGLAKGTKEWTDPKTGKTVKGKSLYQGTTFHRVIPDFMIQGGDPMGTGMGGPGYQFDNEDSPLDTFNRPGLLAMANAGPNTNGSQFFVTVKDATWLDHKYTLFGEVTSGMDVVNKISKVARNAEDKPNKTVTIQSITVKE